MSSAAAVVVTALTAVLGWQIARLAVSSRRSRLALRLALAPGLGLGASSLAFFAAACVADTRLDVFVAFQLAAAAALTAALRARRSAERDEAAPPRADGSRWITLAVGAAFAFAAGVSAFAFGARVARAPLGEWDGWAIWGLKARFLATGASDWTRLFSNVIAWSHPDYPLLLPGSVAQFWLALGVQPTWVPAAIAAVFTFTTVILLFAALAELRGARQGLLAGLVLLAARGYMRHGASLYADIPLSFFMLATLVALALHELRGDTGCLVLAGACAAMAAWTKNEGVPFLVLSACAVAASAATSERRHLVRRDLASFAAGATPPLACLAVLKLHFATGNDLVTAAYRSAPEAGVWDLARHRYVAAEFAREAASCFGIRGGPLAWVALASHVAAAAIGARTLRGAGRFRCCILLGMLASYYLVFISTPSHPGSLMRGSLDRLSFQIAPSAIFLMFLVGRRPDRADAPLAKCAP